jgi:multiple sugar transport system substrate-binding protein
MRRTDTGLAAKFRDARTEVVMRRRGALGALAALGTSALLGACNSGAGPAGEGSRPPGKLRLVFKHQPLWGDPAPFRALLAEFERDNPDVQVVTEPLPNASDVVHQFFLTALEGGARDFDVFVVDVVWVPEFARAGWLADLSGSFAPSALREQFLPGAAEAVVYEGKTWAVPWYVDVGVLYYRSDLFPEPPRTQADLERMASGAVAAGQVKHGYVWQGRQYEGLICNAYEAIWGHGGSTMKDGRLLLDTPEARAGLDWLRRLLEARISPPSVTSMAEEEARRVFQEGNAAFMRNWPYAYAEAQREGSPIRGKVGMVALPSLDGQPGSGALGGYQLALNAHTPSWRREAATKLITHLTSEKANEVLAVSYGRNPPARRPYAAERVIADAPLVARLLPIVERARPRPVSPYYPMISDTLQGEFSAAVSGIRTPAEALARAQRLVDHVMGAG